MKKGTIQKTKNEPLNNCILCPNDFECRSVEDNCKCITSSVLSLVDNRLLFVKCSNTWCAYNMNFGCSTICCSSKRLEIYRKNKL